MMNQQSQPIVDQIPDFLHVMEVTLRSGFNIVQSLEIVAGDLKEPMTNELRQVLAEVQAGESWKSALDNWFTRCPSLELDLLIATLDEQRESGGNLANKFQFIGQLLPMLKRVGY